MANDVQKRNEVLADLESVIGRHSLENGSGTPGFVLASYLYACLQAWNEGAKARDRWWSFDPKIGGIIPAVDPEPGVYPDYPAPDDPDKPVHTYPTGDIIEHDTDGGDCPCKPTIEDVPRDDGTMGRHVIHNALDGREESEPSTRPRSHTHD